MARAIRDGVVKHVKAQGQLLPSSFEGCHHFSMLQLMLLRDEIHI